MDGWPLLLGRLSSGDDLTAGEAAAALADALEGNATPSQLAAFIFGLRCKGETVEEMTGFGPGHDRRRRVGPGCARSPGPAGRHLRNRTQRRGRINISTGDARLPASS
jgi:anthranilate phosphoribosyltransferase